MKLKDHSTKNTYKTFKFESVKGIRFKPLVPFMFSNLDCVTVFKAWVSFFLCPYSLSLPFPHTLLSGINKSRISSHFPLLHENGFNLLSFLPHVWQAAGYSGCSSFPFRGLLQSEWVVYFLVMIYSYRDGD